MNYFKGEDGETGKDRLARELRGRWRNSSERANALWSVDLALSVKGIERLPERRLTWLEAKRLADLFHPDDALRKHDFMLKFSYFYWEPEDTSKFLRSLLDKDGKKLQWLTEDYLDHLTDASRISYDVHPSAISLGGVAQIAEAYHLGESDHQRLLALCGYVWMSS